MLFILLKTRAFYVSTIRKPFMTRRHVKFITTVAKDGKAIHKALHGTVGEHRAYIFLHSSHPPSEFPPRMTTRVQRALQLKALKWGGIVNFAWTGHSPGDTQPATAFSILGGRLEIPHVSLENIDEINTLLSQHVEGPMEPGTSDETHLYVCTHGARDCRCGEHGSRLVQALRAEIDKLNASDHPHAGRVKIAECSHVGGHQYAANMLIYPQGEWLGHLRPENVQEVLTSILSKHFKPFKAIDAPLLPLYWRGRMGTTKDEQLELWKLIPS